MLALCGTKKLGKREERTNRIWLTAVPPNDATRVSYAYHIKEEVKIKDLAVGTNHIQIIDP